MKNGETTPAARRVGPLFAASAGTGITGLTFAGAGERTVSAAGATFGAGGGTIGEIGLGYYYYEAPLSEAVRPWLAVKLAVVCDEFTFCEFVEISPNGIAVGETDATKKRIGPLDARDSSGNKILVAALGGITVQVSINGAAWAAALGMLAMNDDGYPYYTPHATEIAAHGWIAVKLGGTAAQFTLRWDITSGSASAPTVSGLDPASGDPVYANTPISFTITDVDNFASIIPMMVLDPYGTPEPVSRGVVDGDFAFEGLYASSTRIATTNGYRYTIRRKGGWPAAPRLQIWATDLSGSIWIGP